MMMMTVAVVAALLIALMHVCVLCVFVFSGYVMLYKSTLTGLCFRFDGANLAPKIIIRYAKKQEKKGTANDIGSRIEEIGLTFTRTYFFFHFIPADIIINY